MKHILLPDFYWTVNDQPNFLELYQGRLLIMNILLTIRLVPTDYMISSNGRLEFLFQSYIRAEYLYN